MGAAPPCDRRSQSRGSGGVKEEAHPVHPLLQGERLRCPCCDGNILRYEKRVRRETGLKLSRLELRQRWASDHPGAEMHWALGLDDPARSLEDMGAAFDLFSLSQTEILRGREGAESGRDNERLATIRSLGAAIHFLMLHFPLSDSHKLAPLKALWAGLRDLEKGVTAPVLRAVPGPGKHADSARVIDIKARCIVASDLLRGPLSKSVADRLVLDVAEDSLNGAGIKREKSLDSWRRSVRRSRAQHGSRKEITLWWQVECHRAIAQRSLADGYSEPQVIGMLLNTDSHSY
jgi:hypothetical protein